MRWRRLPPLATSLTGVITVLLVYIDLRKLNLRIFDREETGDCMKIVLMTILSLVLCGACYNGLQHFLGEQIAILAGVAVAGVTYLSMSILLRVKIVVWIYQRLPAKVRIISVLNDPVSDK